MNFKILMHIMPWEIDYALLAFDKFKKSSYYINNEDTIFLDSFLNLSDSIIDWENSSLPKNFFIEKYKMLDELIKPVFNHKSYIFEGEDIYGHLDAQKSSIESHIDYYIGVCPDINFHEFLLPYLIETSKLIKNEYFVLTPQIFKSWDSSWDVLVNDIFSSIPYSDCINSDIHLIRHMSLTLKEPQVEKLNGFKFAGWFDLYNKNFYEKLVPTLKEWKGYGPWDLYAMNISHIASQHKVDVAQYILKNQIIWFEDTGCWKNDIEFGGDGKPKMLYKNFLSIKKGRKEQRSHIDKSIPYYIENWLDYAKKSNIIK